VRIDGEAVSIGAGTAPAGGADVWLALYDPRTLEVPVARGENAGRTLGHRNVVKRLERLGAWNGSAVRLTLPDAGVLARAVLVQQRGIGPILGAARG